MCGVAFDYRYKKAVVIIIYFLIGMAAQKMNAFCSNDRVTCVNSNTNHQLFIWFVHFSKRTILLMVFVLTCYCFYFDEQHRLKSFKSITKMPSKECCQITHNHLAQRLTFCPSFFFVDTLPVKQHLFFCKKKFEHFAPIRLYVVWYGMVW